MQDHKSFFIRYAAAIVLLFFVFIHIVFRNTTHISPWLTGGFGMFSTTSSADTYFIKTFATDSAGNERELLVPARFAYLKVNCIYAPFSKSFKKLSDNLIKQHWDTAGGKLQSESQTAILHPVTLKHIRFELWKYKFDIPGSKLFAVRLKEF
ncbi:MAG: hypothetical protein QM791_04890 [Ferruginibacter sp.]